MSFEAVKAVWHSIWIMCIQCARVFAAWRQWFFDIYIFGISRLLRLLLNSTPWFWKFSRILSAFTKNANSNRLFGLQNKHMALSSLLGEWELAFRAKDTWKCWLDSRQSHAPHQHAPYQDVENWAGDSLIFASQYLSDPVCLYASFTGVLEFLWPYLATLFEAIRHIIHQFYGTTACSGYLSDLTAPATLMMLLGLRLTCTTIFSIELISSWSPTWSASKGLASEGLRSQPGNMFQFSHLRPSLSYCKTNKPNIFFCSWLMSFIHVRFT